VHACVCTGIDTGSTYYESKNMCVLRKEIYAYFNSFGMHSKVHWKYEDLLCFFRVKCAGMSGMHAWVTDVYLRCGRKKLTIIVFLFEWPSSALSTWITLQLWFCQLSNSYRHQGGRVYEIKKPEGLRQWCLEHTLLFRPFIYKQKLDHSLYLFYI